MGVKPFLKETIEESIIRATPPENSVTEESLAHSLHGRLAVVV